MPVRHVLVVDDSKSARLMLRRMLQGFGLSVDTVDSAEEALAYLRNQRPDAIFMDHTMPGLDGLTAVRRIKQEIETADIPVTMYTSKDEPAYSDEARTAGAIGVLIKPATPDAISVALDEMNVLFDAAVAARLANAPPPPPVPTLEGMTTAQFEKIASEKAEGVVYDAIESQVLPLINEVIAKVRRDLDAGQEQKWERIVARICDQRLAQWQAPKPDPRDVQAIVETALQSQLPPLLTDRFEAFRREGWGEIEGQVRSLAVQAFQEQLQALSERLTQQLSSGLLEVTQKVEGSTRAAALEAAREVAVQSIAQAMMDQPVQVSPEVVAEQTYERLWARAKSEVWHHIHWAAAWSAAIGIGAALLVYWVVTKAIAA